MVQLTNPPITEAIFDIKVELASNFDSQKLEALHDIVKVVFPVKEVSNEWQAIVELKPGEDPVAQSSGGPNGFLFKSSDGSQILQVRKNGFTLNKLRPYENWESFFREAKKDWELYSEAAQPTKITRLALRYINTVELPIAADLTKYFNYLPHVPDGYPLQDFLIRLVIKHKTAPYLANVILAIDHSKDNESSKTLILDIDTFQLVDNPSKEEIWSTFENLRAFKNEVFFNCLTQEALKPYV